MRTKVLLQECIGKGNTSYHNKPICQCLTHWEAVLGMAWKRLVGDLGIQAFGNLISSSFFPFSFFPSLPSLSSSPPLFLIPFFPFCFIVLLTQGLVHAKHRLCYRAISRPPRLFLTILLRSLSFQNSLPLDAKGRNENGTASPSQPCPVVTHVTSNHVSLVSTWVASQDERKATKYSL